FLLFFVFLAGTGRIGDGPNTTVERIVAGSAAHEAGLETGDKIVAVDGTAVTSWDQMKSAIERNGNQEIEITVVRDGERVTLPATPHVKDGQGFLGVAPGTIVRDVTVVEAVPESFKVMGNVFTGFTNLIGDRLTPSGVSTSAKESF